MSTHIMHRASSNNDGSWGWRERDKWIMYNNNSEAKKSVPPIIHIPLSLPVPASPFPTNTHTSGEGDYPNATLISTSCPSSPSPSSSLECTSSASAAGLLAKSSRSSCRCTCAGGLLLMTLRLASGIFFGDGSPKCKGPSSSSSSSEFSSMWGLLVCSFVSTSDSAFCWLWRARRAAS